jgi:twitching motility protein PilT
MLTAIEIQHLIQRLAKLENGISDIYILSGYPFQVMVYGRV